MWYSSSLGSGTTGALFGDVPEIQCASEAMKKFLQKRLAAQVAHSYRITVAA
jgi:hypothetical protein